MPLQMLNLSFLLAVALNTAKAEERDEFSTQDDTPPMFELLRLKPQSKIFVGKIEKLMGNSSVRRAGGKGKDKPAFGLRVFENDFLVTDEGRLRFFTKSGVIFELGAKTQLSVEKLRLKAEVPETRARFLTGLVHVIYSGELPSQEPNPANAPLVPQKRHRFLIKTMNAVISIPGKADFYLFQAENEKDLAIRMVEGKAEIISVVTNQKAEVSERTGAVLRPSGLLSEITPLKEQLLQAYIAKTKQ